MRAARVAPLVATALLSALLSIGACMASGDDSEFPVTPGAGTLAASGSTGGSRGTDPGSGSSAFPDGGTPLGPDASGSINDAGNGVPDTLTGTPNDGGDFTPLEDAM